MGIMGMKAIDLYSGVGGWSLGLRMAGVDVVRSYEWWAPANRTNFLNNLHETQCSDIRSLDPSSFTSVDIVVGSPPCTQFSLANRGGKGNILEGLKDVEKFLEVVDHLKPRFWLMENVPRLASILSCEFSQGGFLHRFRHLNPNIFVLDSSEWGIPQKRKRLIFGNSDFELLKSYRSRNVRRTLGEIVASLSSSPFRDPIYGRELSGVFDHDFESSLSPEEERINREVKTHHPVYNNMSFPDRLEDPARTVTATCTRVSRESIVVPCQGGFRRLTLRESATLQSFPLDYQFYGETHSQKRKMIGNALPPLLAYHLAHSMLGTKPCDLPPPSDAISIFSAPETPPKKTLPDKPGSSFSSDRKFRFAIPGLRFKSGVRFELSNAAGKWAVRFFYGDSKNTGQMDLGGRTIREIESLPGAKKFCVKARKVVVESGLLNICPNGLQAAWSRSGEGIHPFELLDSLGSLVDRFLAECDPDKIAKSVVSSLLSSRGNPKGSKKLILNSRSVFAGILVCSSANEILSGDFFSVDS